MKTNIKQEKSKTANIIWHSWIEKCDRCGALIHGHELKSTKEPDISESDYCCSCLRYAIDNDIKYD